MSKTRKRTVTQTKPAAISPLMIGVVAAAALLIVGGLIVLGNMGNQVTGQVDLNAFPVEGNTTAPVTMIEYSDYG